MAAIDTGELQLKLAIPPDRLKKIETEHTNPHILTDYLGHILLASPSFEKDFNYVENQTNRAENNIFALLPGTFFQDFATNIQNNQGALKEFYLSTFMDDKWFLCQSSPVTEQGKLLYSMNFVDISLLADTRQSPLFYDSLTKAYSRNFVLEQLDILRRERSDTTVLMIDLDGFKDVNDNHGHKEGDDHLRDVTDFLKANLRDGDIVGRYGGDEFVVILPDTDQDQAKIVIDRLNNLKGTQSPNRKTPFRFSIGAAYNDHNSPKTIDQLLKEADDDMFDRKHLSHDEYEKKLASVDNYSI